MKKVLSIALIAISIFATTACSNEQADIVEKEDNATQVQSADSEKNLENDVATDSRDEDGVSAQGTIKKHFQYQQEKDQDRLLTTLTEKYDMPNVYFGLEDMESLKVLNIEEDESKANIQGYLESISSTENEVSEENIKAFKVKYEIKYVDGSTGPQNSGTYDWNYYVIRKDKNSPWLIDGFGV